MAVTLSVVTIVALSIADTSSAGATVAAPSNWVQSGAPLSGPSPRYDYSMVFDAATGTTVLFGGFNGSELADTWTWNGSAWTKQSPTASPPALRGSAMVFDAATNSVVLFGGLGSGGLSADTWTWDGTTWTKQLPTGPTARSGAAMAYDIATHDVVLFGGDGSTALLSDTWVWSGTAWTSPTLTAATPSPRFESSTAYDNSTQNVVLYGGEGSSGAISDTWTWNGINWTKQPVSSPAGRFGAPMVYDAANNDVILFGGSDGTNNYAETWNWNGTYWTSVSSATNPSARYLSSMAFDTLTNSAVLFGGNDGTNTLSDTWSFNVAPSAPLAVKATSNANTQSVVTWSAPKSNGGSAILSYSIVATDTTTASHGGQKCATTTATTCTVTGLANGDQYVFAVSATNAVGAGSATSSNVVRPATAPGAPTITKVVPGVGQVTVSWIASSITGGTPVASYRVIGEPGAAFCHVPRGTTSCRIGGLHNGTRYTFTMTATNAAGTSAVSIASASVQLGTLPSAPFTVKATSNANTHSVVTWSAPKSNGGSAILGYSVVATDKSTASHGGQTCATTTATTCTVTGLTNGDQYVFAVSATNAVGAGSAASSNVVRPAAAPGAPTITKVVPGVGQVTVSWIASSITGGTPVASYRVIGEPGAAFCHVPRGTTSCRIGGLRHGTHYTFTVTATNAAGTSAASRASAPVSIRTLPSAPFITTKSVVGNYVTIRWRAPASNGGVRLIGYNVYVGNQPNGAATRIARPVPYTRFSYMFQVIKVHTVYVIVRAVNVAGIGPFSNQVAAVGK
jgi:hypothetical protein